jgi:two-component system, cell cycle sensor histidine kinase DivJ
MATSWVNPSVTDTPAKEQDARFISLLLSMPLLSIVNLATSPAAWQQAQTAVPILALAVSLPIIGASLIAISKSKLLRQTIIVVSAPLAFALSTQGAINLLSTAVLLALVLAIEAAAQRFDRKLLATSAVALTAIASMSAASMGGIGKELANLTAFLPAFIAGFVYLLSFVKEQPIANVVNLPSIAFETAAWLADASGLVIVETDRAGLVKSATANANDLLDTKAGKSFVESVHIGDKVALLSLLDAVAEGQLHATVKVRIKSTNLSSNNTPHWHDVVCKIVNAGQTLLVSFSHLNKNAVPEVMSAPAMGASTLAVVSHEMRTPLNAIIGFSDMLEKGMFGEIANGRQREYIELINQSGHHLLGLVNTILDVSKLENGSYELAQELFCPEEAAAFAISMLGRQAQEKKLGLNYLPLTGLEEFSGDRRICQQILINLLSNAVKFTPESGRISLSVTIDERRLVITVEDSGIGMTKDQLAKAGTPFYQASGNANRLYEGAGLGLSLVRQMARLHGGAIEISSEQGTGTKVRVALAPLPSQTKNLSYLRPQEADESARIIQIIEERTYGAERKTA